RRQRGRSRATGRSHGSHPLRLARRRLRPRWLDGERQSRRQRFRRRDGRRGVDRAMNPPASNRGLHRRQGMRRPVVLMPNGLTLFNLFCGIYAIILAIRGEVTSAPAFIVLGGIADTLDGRVARATGTGSRFGEELDSLVDAISFGFAPALIVYLGLQTRGTL